MSKTPEPEVMSLVHVRGKGGCILTFQFSSDIPVLKYSHFTHIEQLDESVQGKNSTVFVGQVWQTRALVLIKMPRARRTADYMNIAREIRAYHKLSKSGVKGIPQFIGLFTNNNRFGLVLEYLPDHVALKYLPSVYASDMRIYHALASTLVNIHATGIVHSDLNMGNVLIDPRGLRDQKLKDFTEYVKVIDFGTSFQNGHKCQLWGAMTYLPLLHSHETQPTQVWTSKVDVYSLGVLILSTRLPILSAQLDKVRCPHRLLASETWLDAELALPRAENKDKDLISLVRDLIHPDDQQRSTIPQAVVKLQKLAENLH